MIITEPKLAWAMAMDSGVRSQLGPIMEDLETGGRVQYSARGGAGASHGSDYAPIYAEITRMEREEPILAAIGHFLCHPSTEQANAFLDAVVEAVEGKVIESIPNWGDGQVWRKAKKAKIHWLIHVALIERQQNLSNAQPEWGPQKIREVMAGWYGVAIVTRKWHQDWLPVWATIQAAINHYEGEAMEPISRAIGHTVRAYRRAA